MWLSVIIPTYNRLPILRQCLQAMERQQPGDYRGYEVIVVDDGSSDQTLAWLASEKEHLPHVRVFEQDHRGPAAARNLGFQMAQGDVIVFIDSDLVVVDTFLHEHVKLLRQHLDQPVFTYGRVINTHHFEDPFQEPFKPTDFSNAFFATGNVAIQRRWLEAVCEEPQAPFDTRFTLYGWEDLELGVRLKKLGVRMIKCPLAAGYHWHPPFKLDDIPRLIDREWQRGRMGVLFYQKHPTWEVRLMIQMTWLHRLLWGLLSLGGWLHERRVRPLLAWLVAHGQAGLALELCRVFFLNWYNVQGVYAAYHDWQKSQRDAPGQPVA
ncbi:MAG: glycosyltransferase family 2 protein [Synechococcales cyanobacterium]